MDHFLDSVTTSEESSPPQTPSPRTSVSTEDIMPSIHSFSSPRTHTAEFDIMPPSPPKPIAYPADPNTAPGVFQGPYWPEQHPPSPNRGSFLSDLYGPELKFDPNTTPPPPADMFANPDWSAHHQLSHQQHQHHQHHQHQHSGSNPIDIPFYRRASFPHSQHDHADGLPPAPAFLLPDAPTLQHAQQHPHMHPHHHQHHQQQMYSRQDTIYAEPLPLSAHPAMLHHHHPHHHHHHQQHYMPSVVSISPDDSLNAPMHEYDPVDLHLVKSESNSPVIVPTQATYYRPSSAASSASGATGGGASSPGLMGIAPSQAGQTLIPVMHTDDAASKETQYLRRRCFNCSTTEPPSWRRSTLNPGKIVCNKCGLYERTHLRPRPHRFDELRAGNKIRKNSTSSTASNSSVTSTTKGVSPPSLSPKSKKENVNSRRGSVASHSSANSNANDWDEQSPPMFQNSTPTSGFNSPPSANLTNPTSATSLATASPIRLPTASLAYAAPSTPNLKKAGTTTPPFTPPALANPPPVAVAATPSNADGRPGSAHRPIPPSPDYFARRGSLEQIGLIRRHTTTAIPTLAGTITPGTESLNGGNSWDIKAKNTPVKSSPLGKKIAAV